MNSGCSESCGLGLVGVGLAVDDVVPPDVAAVVPVDVVAGAAHDEDLLDRVGQCCERLVDGGLEGGGRDRAGTAAVGGDDDLGLGVVDAAAQRLGGEAAEDHRVRGAERAQASIATDGLGDHRHVDRRPVAGFDAEAAVRALAAWETSSVQVGVGDGRGCRRARPRSGSRPCRRCRPRRAGRRSCTRR
jgi:hypothetical protein